MAAKGSDDHTVPAGNAADSAGQGPHPAAHKDHFLQLMLFQASRAAGAAPPAHAPELAKGSYASLPHSTAGRSGWYSLPLPSAGKVQLDSPAIEVMTDLRRVSAITVERDTSIVEANRVMISRNVRALFVIDDARRMHGVITATDIRGERPIQVSQERGIHHNEVAVRDIMTPAERLEVLELHAVLRARVGDLVATLKLAGRQHALVVDGAQPASGQRTVCGIFSLTQIARQLGIPPQETHDIARTFAEIEAVIAS